MIPTLLLWVYRDWNMHRSLNALLLLSVLFLGGTLSGCGSDTPENTADPANPAPGEEILLDPAGPSVDPEDLASAEIVSVPGSDLSVAYTTSENRDLVTSDYVAAQWEHMQACLGIRVPAPVVVVISGWLVAGESVDDVLLSFDGRLLASSVARENADDIVRISTFDFDGSQGNAGFHLRSILGRYIWTVSTRPIRDYDTGCASGQ